VSTPLPSTQASQSQTESRGQEHVVKSGETLSAIARMYDIHVDVLRFLNDIHNNDLPVGLKLHIPARNSDG
jgi:LysM repeat protein